MRRRANSIATLIAVATIFPELVTGSTPAFRFFYPLTIFILLVGYGLAVLVLREIAVRLRLSYGGIYLLGFAYAIVNEGFLAKTLLVNHGLPIAQYNHYGYFAGVSFPWAFVISAWHALASVLLPIVLTDWLFPDGKRERWLGNRTLAGVAAFVIVISGLVFFSPNRVRGTLPMYLILAAMMMVWFLVAFGFGREKAQAQEPMPAAGTEPPRRPGWGIFILGASTLVPTFIVLSALAERKVHVAIFIAVLALEIGLYAWALWKRGAVDARGILLFGAGFYLQQAALGLMAGTLMGRSLLIITDAVMIALFIAFGKKVRTAPGR